MATRRPLVLISGIPQRLPDGDSISGAALFLSGTNNAASAVSAGQPVYVDAADGFDLAQADAIGTSRVVGLVADATVNSAAEGNLQYGGVLEQADWTAATGGAVLTPGSRYYLSATTPGQITNTAPDSAGDFVTGVGIAMSTTKLLIEIGTPIGA